MSVFQPLENMPSNQGYIFAGQEMFGFLPRCGDTVKLMDLDTNKVHVWDQNGHVVYSQDIDGFWIDSSTEMVSCAHEAKHGECPDRDDPEHDESTHHYCHSTPRFHYGKPVCRFSLTDDENLCWERCNPQHNETYHHEN